jgi:hypothetical protein
MSRKLSNHDAVAALNAAEKLVDLSEISFGAYCIYPLFRAHFHAGLIADSSAARSGFKMTRANAFYMLACTFLGFFSGLRLLRRRRLIFTHEERFKASLGTERVAGCVNDVFPGEAGFFVNPDFLRRELFPWGQRDAAYIAPWLAVASIIRFFLTVLRKKWQFGEHVDRSIEQLSSLLGVGVPLSALKSRFVTQYIAAKLLFAAIRPIQVYVINHPSFTAFIVAAREVGIPVIEIQHGVINSGHPTYSWESMPERAAVPDIFIFWGDYFRRKVIDSTLFSSGICHGLIGGYYSINRIRKERVADHAEHVPTVLFSGQASPHENVMIAFLESIAADSRLSGFRVVYVPRVWSSEVARRLASIGIECNRDHDDNLFWFSGKCVFGCVD